MDAYDTSYVNYSGIKPCKNTNVFVWRDVTIQFMYVTIKAIKVECFKSSDIWWIFLYQTKHLWYFWGADQYFICLNACFVCMWDEWHNRSSSSLFFSSTVFSCDCQVLLFCCCCCVSLMYLSCRILSKFDGDDCLYIILSSPILFQL